MTFKRNKQKITKNSPIILELQGKTEKDQRILAGKCLENKKDTIQIESKYANIGVTFIIEKKNPRLLSINTTKEWYSTFRLSF